MIVETALGARYLGQEKTALTVWAPDCKQVELHILEPEDRTVKLHKQERGYFSIVASGVRPGCRYFFRLDGREEYPDPASRFQPLGVHGPSEIVDSIFPWDDDGWKGLPLDDYVIYELHTGIFSSGGTFDGIIPYLPYLRELGITAIELMPVAQFPGERNWGYDGVFLYAPQNSYGGPEGLKRLVNECHRQGMAAILDVVYNHVGPEGNCLNRFGPYFTGYYKTPWGQAVNFDGRHSDEVRRFFIRSAMYWITEFHFDALRLDALHAIMDNSSYTFIEELADVFHRRRRQVRRNIYLIGESAANDSRLIRAKEKGGYGIDAQWNDDFHHALHTLLTGEDTDYYRDFGSLRHMVKAYREGFVYTGQYSVFRERRHGTSARDIPASRFVVFSQNHDHVGNRPAGDRLSGLVSYEVQKLAAGMVLLSPYVPLLFMGEEYGETAPFPYFVSHTDPVLVEAVRKGRKEEFAGFSWEGEVPDPQAEATFLAAKLRHEKSGKNLDLLDFYRRLIRVRTEVPVIRKYDREASEISGDETTGVIHMRLVGRRGEAVIVFNTSGRPADDHQPLAQGDWQLLVDSASPNPPETVTSEGTYLAHLPGYAFKLFTRGD